MVDAPRIWVLVALATWIGTTLILSELRWFRRASLTDRLVPFAGGVSRAKPQSLSSFREALLPIASLAGERMARALGVKDDLASRLRRAHFDLDVAAFRTRQFGWTAAGLALGLIAAVALQPPLAVSLVFVAGAPVLAFLLLEQQLASAVQARQRTLFAELPVVSEQLAMLLSAGFSLGAALNRLAERNDGVSGEDLRVVCDRIRHGLTTTNALREWADVAAVPELHRLVSVLALSSETSDLGRLVSEEARNIRRESLRLLAEVIDRRGQQVWVPVTVATLIPGVIFLTIPFLQALQLFSGS